jgi:N-acetylmuramoyl-L-alanine amidase
MNDGPQPGMLNDEAPQVRSSFCRHRSSFRHRPLLILGGVVGFTLLLWPLRPLRSENFVFYLSTGHKLVPVTLIENARYLPLLQVLGVVGAVNNMQQKPNSLKLQLGTVEMEFHAGDQKVRINKEHLKLADPVRLANGDWMVPLEFLYSVLPRLTQQTLEYRMGDKRMFVGDLRPATFSVRLDPISNGARLSLEFTGKVTIQTAARNGKWIIYLRDQHVQPLEATYRFQSPYVSELQFDDQDGVPKLTLTPAAPGLDFYPKLSVEGQVVMADVVNPAAAVAALPGPQGTAPSAVTPTPGTGQPVAPTAPGGTRPTLAPQPALPTVALDAGHGGEDTGARSRDGINEKDLTAQLVERVRQGLVATGRFRVVLTRAGDTNPSFDERNVTANTAQPVAFVTFHAGNMGGASPCAAVYIYATSPEPPAPAGGPFRIFTPWKAAQQRHLPQSEKLAKAVSEQVAQIAGLARSAASTAPVRQLRSSDAPAIAVEVGTLSPEVDAGALTDPEFQRHIADALVQALMRFGAS